MLNASPSETCWSSPAAATGAVLRVCVVNVTASDRSASLSSTVRMKVSASIGSVVGEGAVKLDVTAFGVPSVTPCPADCDHA